LGREGPGDHSVMIWALIFIIFLLIVLIGVVDQHLSAISNYLQGANRLLGKIAEQADQAADSLTGINRHTSNIPSRRRPRSEFPGDLDDD
jgi:hypothetical protein